MGHKSHGKLPPPLSNIPLEKTKMTGGEGGGLDNS